MLLLWLRIRAQHTRVIDYPGNRWLNLPVLPRMFAVIVIHLQQIGLPAEAYVFSMVALYAGALAAEGMINLVTKLTCVRHKSKHEAACRVSPLDMPRVA